MKGSKCSLCGLDVSDASFGWLHRAGEDMTNTVELYSLILYSGKIQGLMKMLKHRIVGSSICSGSICQDSSSAADLIPAHHYEFMVSVISFTSS